MSVSKEATRLAVGEVVFGQPVGVVCFVVAVEEHGDGERVVLVLPLVTHQLATNPYRSARVRGWRPRHAKRIIHRRRHT